MRVARYAETITSPVASARHSERTNKNAEQSSAFFISALQED
jgi:hypothetical protein